MIQEAEIREFRDIIDGRSHDFDQELFDDDIQDDDNDNDNENENEFIGEESGDAPEVKKESTNTTILFVTGIAGLIFFISVFIGALTYIYLKYDTNTPNSANPKSSQSLKIPGLESLVTDPIPDGSGKRIKVWCVRTAVPPTPQIGDYREFFSDF